MPSRLRTLRGYRGSDAGLSQEVCRHERKRSSCQREPEPRTAGPRSQSATGSLRLSSWGAQEHPQAQSSCRSPSGPSTAAARWRRMGGEPIKADRDHLHSAPLRKPARVIVALMPKCPVRRNSLESTFAGPTPNPPRRGRRRHADLIRTQRVTIEPGTPYSTLFSALFPATYEERRRGEIREGRAGRARLA